MYSKHEYDIEEHIKWLIAEDVGYNHVMVAHEEGSIFLNFTCEEKVYDVTTWKIFRKILMGMLNYKFN